VATFLKMDSNYPTVHGPKSYRVSNVPGGFSLMFFAGTLSGLLGIGSGAVKVLAMDQVMRIPFKVSTTTSTFMIGVTAAASAGVYLGRGYIDPVLAMPVMPGGLAVVLLGLSREGSNTVVPPDRFAPMCISSDAPSRSSHPWKPVSRITGQVMRCPASRAPSGRALPG